MEWYEITGRSFLLSSIQVYATTLQYLLLVEYKKGKKTPII